MKFNKKALIIVSCLALLTAGYVLINNRAKDYVIVTEDRRNVCFYNESGHLKSTSLAMPDEVKMKVPKEKYEQYKKDAIASKKCFY